jgi:hypothetical protein
VVPVAISTIGFLEEFTDAKETSDWATPAMVENNEEAKSSDFSKEIFFILSSFSVKEIELLVSWNRRWFSLSRTWHGPGTGSCF